MDGPKNTSGKGGRGESRPSTKGVASNPLATNQPAGPRSPIRQGSCDCPSLTAKKREAPSGLPSSTRHPLKKAVTKDNKSLLCPRYRWRWCNANALSNQANPSFLSTMVLEREGRTLGLIDCLFPSHLLSHPSQPYQLGQSSEERQVNRSSCYTDSASSLPIGLSTRPSRGQRPINIYVHSESKEHPRCPIPCPKKLS